MIDFQFLNPFKESKDNLVYDYELMNFSENVVLKNKYSIPRMFRYSSADYLNIRNLETQSLFLSPVDTMNDIFEGLSCEIDDHVIDRIEDLHDIAYLKSFSEEKNNLIMWAHYAKDYSGMCVEYDFSQLSDNFLYHLYPIYYSNKRFASANLKYVITEYQDLKKMNEERCSPNECGFLKDIMYLFLAKNEAWSYEREWRLLATYPQIKNMAEDIDDEQEMFYKINNQLISVASCIKGVYLGPRMKRSIKEHIKEICRDRLNSIPVYSARLSKDKYMLEFIPEGV